jgi:hypothetical protein
MSSSKRKSVYENVKEVAAEIKLRDGIKKNDKVSDQLARDLIFFDELDARLDKLVGSIKYTKPVKMTKGKMKTVANLLLSDLHFGSMLGPEVMYPYGSLEESRRFGSVISQTVNGYSERADHINVYLMGDIIQNQLHDVRDGAPLAAQASAAIHYLTQGLAQLANSFSKVDVYCSTGNHGRFTSRHSSRATHQKWDSLEQVIYYAVSKVFSKSKNVSVHLNKNHYVMHDVLGHTVFATHGDTVMEVGSPNKVISVKGVEANISRISSNFQKKPSVFLCGHTHSPLVHVMGTGARLIMNGALVPSDEYSQTQGWFSTTSGQWAWLTSEECPSYDIRFLEVSKKDDADKTLNEVISAYDY